MKKHRSIQERMEQYVNQGDNKHYFATTQLLREAEEEEVAVVLPL